MKNIQRQLLIDAKEKKNRIFIATKSNLKEKKIMHKIESVI